MSLFSPTSVWRRTRPATATAQAADTDDSSTLQSDGAAPTLDARTTSAGTLWQRVTDWLAGDPWAPSEPAALSPRAALPAAQEALVRELADIQTLEAHRLVLRIRAAHNRAELLHLRSALFELVARVRDQADAMARLERLAPHFPLRSTGPSIRHA